MIKSLDIRLEQPETSLTELSFAEKSEPALSQWAGALPVVNIDETATQLKLATAELALLQAPAHEKFAYLEAIRPLLHYICARMDRNMLFEAKSARESQTQRLLLNLCNGYKGVVLDALTEHENSGLPNKELLPGAIHRLTSDLSRILLRSQQLCVQPPANFWWELNELYRLSERLNITDFSLQDDENHSSRPLSIKAAYLRALLLASCKPNQLQHAQLVQIFNVLESWSSVVTLAPQRSDAPLVIDLMGNNGPQYNKLTGEIEEPRGLHTEILAYEIEAYLNDVHGRISIPGTLSRELLKHLVNAWSLMQSRAFTRITANTTIRVAVGIRATHYFLSGGREFSEQISNTGDLLRREINPFLDVDYEPSHGDDRDPWSQAHDLKTRIPINPNIESPERILLRDASEGDAVANFRHFETQALDTSPGGYRIEWMDTVPSNAAVGTLIALREERAARWCVAVIAWIQHEGKRICTGVKLLSPRAIPVALRAIQKKGGPTDYARGFLLPAIDPLQQPATLITPRVPFIEGQKVQIQRQGIQSTGQLLETRLKTESFNQFTFRMLDGYLENVRSDSNIDSLSARTREDTSQGP